MLNDLEVTGQAFEDMQEQNLRLLQQLREKDDANFKLMSEVNSLLSVRHLSSAALVHLFHCPQCFGLDMFHNIIKVDVTILGITRILMRF